MPRLRKDNKEKDEETSLEVTLLLDPSVVDDGLTFPRPRGLHKRSRSRNFLGRSSSAWGKVQPSSPSRSNNNKKKKLRSDIPRKQGNRSITTRSHAKDVDIVVRPMNMADIADIYHLGNAIFTASDFPNLFRTWDDYTVVQNFESSPEFCFVAEAIQQNVDTEEDDSSPKSNNNKMETVNTNTKEVVAFLLGDSLTKRTCGTRGYIQWVAVDPPFRRQGIAKSLLAAYVDAANDQNISLLLADTPADNHQAIQMFAGVGLSQRMDHVYLTCRLDLSRIQQQHVDEDGSFSFSYTVKRKKITIRNMEVEDLHPVYAIGEKVFTKEFSNIHNFWDEHTVMSSYLSDPEFCVVATVREKLDNEQEGNPEYSERVIGFAFGTTIEKPRSSWKYGWLVWLGCDPDFQGMGLATQMYNTMAELFALEKVNMIMIDTQASNDGALAFFRKQGFGQDEEHVYLSNTKS
ncbi:GCN5-like N-acetyltransferase [Nitzschia inconspicua]|uniref:GCN5-like N-acetyltransferase n=1 Tax=Nitzschia inconspicua TaxID=303405 RepID=A0A9K3PJ79_9STRA|nr:GCN5-like N-acetyltransferase [Nitzschia inconspicua]